LPTHQFTFLLLEKLRLKKPPSLGWNSDLESRTTICWIKNAPNAQKDIKNSAQCDHFRTGDFCHTTKFSDPCWWLSNFLLQLTCWIAFQLPPVPETLHNDLVIRCLNWIQTLFVACILQGFEMLDAQVHCLH